MFFSIVPGVKPFLNQQSEPKRKTLQHSRLNRGAKADRFQRNTLKAQAIEGGYQPLPKNVVEAFALIPEPADLPVDQYKMIDDSGWDRLLQESGLNPDYRDLHGCSPLHYAAITQNHEAVSKLLKLGANINLVAHWGETPLMLAATRGHTKMVQHLLEEGADPNFRLNGPWPQSAMVFAARDGHVETLKVLLSRGISQQNKNDALTAAARAGHPKAVSLMLTHGADPNHKDMQGLPPLICAVRSAPREIEEVVIRLVKAGADPNAILSSTGSSPLIWMTHYSKDKAIETLLDAGADPYHQNLLKQSPVSLAKFSQNPKVRELLSEKSLRAAKTPKK